MNGNGRRSAAAWGRMPWRAIRASPLRRTGSATRDQLTSVLEPLFGERTAAESFAALDAAGAPCEISEERFGQGYGFFDHPDARANDWVAKYRHHSMGMIEQPGKLFSLSETPGEIWGPPPVRGEHSREVLRELDYSDGEIQALQEQGATTWPS